MKTLILFTLFLSSLSADISWFNTQSLEKKSDNYYIGYASDKNLNRAKLLAKKDIAQQISLSIKSVDSSRYERNIDGKNVNEFSSKVQQSALVHLELTQILKIEEENNIFYVALGYENITFEQRLAQMLRKKKCVNSSQHPYLKQTSIFKKINALTTCTFNIEMAKKNTSWGLSYEDIFLRIPKSKINEFYITTSSAQFSVTPSSYRLRNGESFNFNIESSKDGYLTLFDVYANGIVTVIEDNLKVYKGIKTTYPHPKSKLELQAGVLENESETFDLYLAVLSKKPLNLSIFTESSEEVEKEQFHYNIDKLLELTTHYPFVSNLLRIKP